MDRLFEQLGVYIWIAAATVFLLFDLSLIAIIPSCRKNMKHKLITIYKSLFWNGMIRSITVSYLQAWVYCQVLAKEWYQGDEMIWVDI